MFRDNNIIILSEKFFLGEVYIHYQEECCHG